MVDAEYKINNVDLSVSYKDVELDLERIFLESFRIGGGKRTDECLRAFLSIELCHNYFLMHDDIMDRDELRRGGKDASKIRKTGRKSERNRSRPCRDTG